MVPKTAVIGATGFIGKRFFTAYRRIYPDCIGTCRDINQEDMLFFDLFFPSIGPLKLSETGHQEALIVAGITNIAQCEKEKELSRKINVDGTLDFIQQFVREGIKPIFFSSDTVFDGVAGLYDEDSLPQPLNEYGRQKVEIESGIKEICADGNYLIVRISKIFSLERGNGTLFDEMATTLKSGKVVRAAYDQIFSPLFIFDLLEIITILQTKGVTGVININPLEIWSRYDLALTLAKCMGVNPNRIEKISLDDLGETFKRPKNTTMKTDKIIQKTGYKFMPMIQYIEQIAQSWIENDIGAKGIKA